MADSSEPTLLLKQDMEQNILSWSDIFRLAYKKIDPDFDIAKKMTKENKHTKEKTNTKEKRQWGVTFVRGMSAFQLFLGVGCIVIAVVGLVAAFESKLNTTENAVIDLTRDMRKFYRKSFEKFTSIAESDRNKMKEFYMTKIASNEKKPRTEYYQGRPKKGPYDDRYWINADYYTTQADYTKESHSNTDKSPDARESSAKLPSRKVARQPSDYTAESDYKDPYDDRYWIDADYYTTQADYTQESHSNTDKSPDTRESSARLLSRIVARQPSVYAAESDYKDPYIDRFWFNGDDVTTQADYTKESHSNTDNSPDERKSSAKFPSLSGNLAPLPPAYTAESDYKDPYDDLAWIEGYEFTTQSDYPNEYHPKTDKSTDTKESSPTFLSGKVAPLHYAVESEYQSDYQDPYDDHAWIKGYDYTTTSPMSNTPTPAMSYYVDQFGDGYDYSDYDYTTRSDYTTSSSLYDMYKFNNPPPAQLWQMEMPDYFLERQSDIWNLIDKRVKNKWLIMDYLCVPAWTGIMYIITGLVELRMMASKKPKDYLHASRTYTLLNFLCATLFAPGMMAVGLLQWHISQQYFLISRRFFFRIVVGQITLGFAAACLLVSLALCFVSCCCPVSPACQDNCYKVPSESKEIQVKEEEHEDDKQEISIITV